MFGQGERRGGGGHEVGEGKEEKVGGRGRDGDRRREVEGERGFGELGGSRGRKIIRRNRRPRGS